jgi:fructose-1,6-bisphosphatase/inositol monophosphatase family enzyme
VKAPELLTLFEHAADAARDTVAAIEPAELRRRTHVPGQYHLDVLADRPVLECLAPAGARILSEESGWSGPEQAAITIVVDPVDGSTNCSLGIPYWAISLCAIDVEGPRCALVRNQATGSTTTAVRGEGAWRDGERLRTSDVRDVGTAVVAIEGRPQNWLDWWQFRCLGSAALALCDVGAGTLDGYINSGGRLSPWDYLGGLLVCEESGASVVDAEDRPLAVADPDAHRSLVAAGTPELLAELRGAFVS